jgi:CP family cyanate transporter-like MFS transporter
MKVHVEKSNGQTGTRYLLLFLGIILIAVNLRGAVTGVGPLVGDIRSSTHLSSALTGMLTSLPLVAFGILSPLVPRLSARFGMEFTLFVSLIVLTLGIFIRSIPFVTTLFLGTILIGMGIAIGNVLLPSLIKRDFPDRVGFMTGMYSFVMSIFASLASGLSVPLAHGMGLGWNGALLCWAVLSVLACIVWIPQLRQRNVPLIRRSKESLWRSGLAWQVTLFMGLQSVLFYIGVAWLPEVLTDKGMSVEAAGWMLSLMVLFTVPSTFVVAILAGQKPSQRWIVIVCAILSLIGYGGLLIFGATLALLWMIFIGISSGSSLGLALILFNLRTNNAQQAAELSGMAQCIGYLLAAIGPILFGYLHDVTHSWQMPLITLLVATVLLLVVGLGAGRDAKVHLTAEQ